MAHDSDLVNAGRLDTPQKAEEKLMHLAAERNVTRDQKRLEEIYQEEAATRRLLAQLREQGK